ncbi:hypothetical protein QZH41_006881 [Actinostola sp. cb2023]|nr:hypothetical protein QZH41_006881 [Actinostola sp. cb2023]
MNISIRKDAIEPTIDEKPQDMFVILGQSVTLKCRASGKPKPKIKWFFGTQSDALVTSSKHTFTSDGSLVISKIEDFDFGDYKCQAKNFLNSLTATAKISKASSVKLAEYNVINHHKFNKGSTAKIYCSFTGSGPIVVKWKKVGVKNIDKNMESSGGMLIIKNIHINDGGTYLCTGSNLFSNSTVRVNISVFGDPKPKISWGREQDGGDRLDQERFHQFANGTLRIENIIPQDQGRYYCYAGNPGSFTQITISVRVVTPPGITNASKASAMGRTIAIAVGCAAAYIVLVVGLMIYCKRRRAKQQKKEQLVIPIDGDGENLEANAEMALQPINGKVTNYNKMEFPRHDLEALRTLGNGSYGRAFLARASGIKDGERETMVVVKSLMSKDDIQKEDFLRELNSLINMDNPHVVALLGVCRDMDPLYMIFESLEKENLLYG